MAVALTPAITVMPTVSPSSSADRRVTSAVRVEPKSIVVRTNGPKGTIFVIVPVSRFRTLVFGKSPSLIAMVTSSGRIYKAYPLYRVYRVVITSNIALVTIYGHAHHHWIPRPRSDIVSIPTNRAMSLPFGR